MNGERMYNDHSFDHGSIFNKLQEESTKKGYTINHGIVNNGNYNNNSNSYYNESNRVVDKNDSNNITVGKVLGGLAIFGGLSYLAYKYIYKPIKNLFEDLQDEITVRPEQDRRIFDGNCRPLTHKEIRELLNDSNTVICDPNDYIVR